MGFICKIFDVFNAKNKSDIDKIIGDEITIFFTNGKLYKVSPPNTEDYYDARFLVSDNKLYDLEKIDDIKKINIPAFQPLKDDNYGVTGLLDYVLRAKSRAFYNRREKELCSACLWKATEIMFANHLCVWSKKDYIRLINYHLWLGMEDEAQRAQKYLESKGMIFTNYELQNKKSANKKQEKSSRKKRNSSNEKVNWREKELIMVQNITNSDMKELNMPFICNTEIKKHIREGSHPFVYMEIHGDNIGIVKSELQKMNNILKESIKDYPNIPQKLAIPIDSIIFHSYTYGYTRIICAPKTYEGNKSEYPYTLSFCTDLSQTKNITTGELTYGQDGTVKKATIAFWRNRNGPSLNFKTINGNLMLTDIGQSKPNW